ncbi:unnamed protein product [Mytilus coruscus]|uniref:Cohesin loading complex subunit SCC4 homolog n=1 Tax=Mytilus coruscus TaxID=42192 RepID=A0A6J8ET56_MYTCO|nr:unnamed protein product [Mytilus coruscus]
MTLPLNTTDSAISKLVASMHEIMTTVLSEDHRLLNLLYHFLHNSNTIISRCIFLEMFSFAHQNVPQISQDQARSNNKHKYYKYKRDLSHLLIGSNSDAVGGMLMLASFFYVRENYFLSLYIINHTLRQCTNEKISVKYPNFRCKYPQELNLNVIEQVIPFHPMIFAHLLSFLCNYHLYKNRSCEQSLIQLRQIIMQHIITNQWNSLFIICLGICHQMIGETDIARQLFLLATKIDEHNLTSAAFRLLSLY